MLATRDFLFLHIPKTGGTFVEKTIRRLHRERGDRVAWLRLDERGRPVGRRAKVVGPDGVIPRSPPVVEIRGPRGTASPHSRHLAAWEIPRRLRHLPLVASIRNPYDWFVSAYEFRGLTENAPLWGDGLAQLRARGIDPHAIPFDEYVALATVFHRPPPFPLDHDIGPCTFRFLRGIGADPSVMERIADDPESWRDHVRADVRWLRTERLNDDLASLLEDVGYGSAETDAVRRAARIYPTRASDDLPGGRSDDQRDWRAWYTPEVHARVRHLERLLFEAFPHYDVPLEQSTSR